MKIKKRKKSGRMRGTRYHGYAMKKHKGKGNRGGKGMAGTGKRGDQRKTYILTYMKNYFGKRKVPSRKKIKSKITTINLRDVIHNIKKYSSENNKKNSGEKLIVLENKKVIGNSEIKEKIFIKAYDFSQKAKECIEKSGGKCEILKKEGFLKKE